MLTLNTASDLQAASASPEYQAFLQALLNDFVIFDDAKYPDDYDWMLQPGDKGFVKPVIRKEWNAGSAASWGFASREQIEELLAAQ
jgi:hypothetical protein